MTQLATTIMASTARPQAAGGDSARLAVVLLILVYIGLLRVSYTSVISPHYAYLGYAWARPSWWSEAGFVLLVWLPALGLPITLARPSQYTLWFLYTIVVIPAVLVPLYAGTLPILSLLSLSLVLLGCFMLLAVSTRLPRVGIPGVVLPPSLFWAGVLCLLVLVLGVMRAVFGTQASMPGLSTVYERRAEFKEAVKASGSGVVYLSLWLANVVNPLLMARALLDRRWLWGLAGVLGELAVFSVSGFKSVLLAPVLIVGVAALMADGGRRFGVRFVGALVAFLGAGLVLGPLLPIDLLTGLIVRRLIVTPGLLTGIYAQYFSTHPKAMLARSIFGSLADDYYGQTPPLVIGQVYFPTGATNANANLWADAFANFGLGGIFVMTVVLACVLWLYDSLSADKRLGFTVLVLAMPTFSLTNSALLTTLATHGLGLALVMVWLFPKVNSVRVRPSGQ